MRRERKCDQRLRPTGCSSMRSSFIGIRSSRRSMISKVLALYTKSSDNLTNNSRHVPSLLMKHDARAEEGVLFQLKTRGPQTAAHVARRLEVTAMAVRQHLYRLKVEGLVEFTDERPKVGRPARVWRLTRAAGERFPATPGDLTVDMIGALRCAYRLTLAEQ